jgi:hypothetical protein
MAGSSTSVSVAQVTIAEFLLAVEKVIQLSTSFCLAGTVVIQYRTALPRDSVGANTLLLFGSTVLRIAAL